MRRTAGALLTGLLLPLCLTVPARADTLRLPTAEQSHAQTTELLRVVGATVDRLRTSVVPGPVRNDEVVRVALDGTGAPASVLLDQRLRLSGAGDYAIFERGPARTTRSLDGQQPPIAKFGAVVWQGFSPGGSDLAAELTLDPGLEAPRLPMTVGLSFTPTGGRPQPLPAGGRVPGAGTVTVTLTDATEQPADLPVATGVPAAALAGPLDRARAAAAGQRLPVAGAGLPASLPAARVDRTTGTASVPLRISGSLLLPGATVTGAGTAPVAGGAQLTGTLTTTTTVTLRATGPGTLALDLRAEPALDQRTLVPPGGAPSWAAWARRSPNLAQRDAAAALLVQVAATGARATSSSPYLGADLPGAGSTAFVYTVAPAPAAAAVVRRLTPRRVPLALGGLGVLLAVAAGGALWRRL